MTRIRTLLFGLVFLLSFSAFEKRHQAVFIEAERFTNRGGWVVDQQSMDVMGSAYMLAHGLGAAVADAEATIDIPSRGNYRIWVRTRDWVAPWQVGGSSGKFQDFLNGEALATTFGMEQGQWHWQDGGTRRLKAGETQIALHDLTGFKLNALRLLLNA